MIRFYLIALIMALICGAYCMGRSTGYNRCTNAYLTDVAAKQSQQIIYNIKLQEKLNAQTNHTAVRDIRRVLREKYTIAE